MAILEGGESALACASGMAAICAALFGLLSAGDEMMYVGTLYGGTLGVMQNLLPKMGVHVTGVPDLAGLREAITTKTKIVYVETPSNPTLEIIDLSEIASVARGVGSITIADNTFSTPYLTRPIEFDIDIVVHSATKYIGGHGDATGGIVVGPKTLLDDIRTASAKQFGGCMSPNDAFLFVRGLKTPPIRMDATMVQKPIVCWMVQTSCLISDICIKFDTMNIEKEIRWIGSSYNDILDFPDDPRREAGFQLGKVQAGLDPDDWKPFDDVDAGTREIRVKDGSGIYRVMYVAKFEEAIYVLHCFQKKTEATTKHDKDIAEARYRAVVQGRRAKK